MLKIGNDDFIARPDVLLSERPGDKVDRLRSAAREDDLFRRARAQKARHFAACALVGVGGASCQLVCGAVDIRILVLVEIFEPLDDGLRLLRRRRVVEPDQRTAVDRLVQDRKIAADGVDVEADDSLVASGVAAARRRAPGTLMPLVGEDSANSRK